MDQILKSHLNRVKKFRFHFEDSKDPVVDLSKAMYDQSGKVWRVIMLDVINKESRGKVPLDI